jgi:hypothetical protein
MLPLAVHYLFQRSAFILQNTMSENKICIIRNTCATSLPSVLL